MRRETTKKTRSRAQMPVMVVLMAMKRRRIEQTIRKAEQAVG